MNQYSKHRVTAWPGELNASQIISRPKFPQPHMPVALKSIPEEHTFAPRIGKPWNFYHGFLRIELGGPATLAYRKRPDRQVFAIKQIEGTYSDIQGLLENSHKNIIRCYDTYAQPDCFFLVEECMDVSLLEVVACPWDLEEEQIATVCTEVDSLIAFLFS
jgi:hypothetical protein